MSNTIRKPRKRPRVKSCSFLALGWLIRHEAAFRILNPNPPGWAERGSRARWSRIETQDIERTAQRLIKQFPKRRYYP